VVPWLRGVRFIFCVEEIQQAGAGWNTDETILVLYVVLSAGLNKQLVVLTAANTYLIHYQTAGRLDSQRFAAFNGIESF
jgi:hypothetical protein